MKTLISFATIRALGTAAGLLLGAVSLRAQDGPPPGNFDPAQMRQRMMERLREAFDVKEDSEWKIISERVSKVMDARRAARGPGGPGGFGGPGGPPPAGGMPPAGGPTPGGDNGPGQGDPGQSPGGQGEFRGPPPGGPGGFMADASPELEALRKAIDSKASTSELKARLVEFKAARQKKQAELEQAQEQLRQVLSLHQEAVAVTFGLL